MSPSAYEGFGFAVADALAAAVPTVIANISSLPELCGEAAVRLSSLDAAAIVTALGDLLRDPARCQQLAQAGLERAKQFSWQMCAEGHVRAYHAAMRR